MRIAIIADPLDNQQAGVHTYTRQLVDALLREKGQHEILLIREKRDTDLTGAEQIVIPNTRLPIGFASFRLFVLIPLVLLFKKVDVVFEPAHFGPFNLPRSIKRATMIHDLTPLLYPQYHRWHSQLLQRIFLKGILRRTDLIFSNSENTSRDLHRIFPFTEGKVQTILLGRDPFFKPADSEETRDQLGIQKPYFLFVGTFEPRKQLQVLLAAFAEFQSGQRDKQGLVLVGGKGWKTSDIYDKIKAHPCADDIMLTGYVSKEQLRALYSGSTALIYPSEYEGFGLPILEAMACGTNVICSDNSSLPEVGGELALYFKTGDAADLYHQMQYLIAHSAEAKEKRKAGPERASLFSWTKHAQSFLRALEETVGKPSDREKRI
ncbi:MAG: glycosyltransferase family 4 protein [Bacteroidetes bacterium]|nr:glycosyltransferase family 4 protein [Bacteroidota bacterium]